MEIKIYKIFKQLLFLSIPILLVGCKSHVSQTSNNHNADFENIIVQIDKETRNEINWLTGEATGGIIVYDGYKFLDVDCDGIDELFVLRKYVNNKEKYINDINKITSIGDYYKFAIRRGFISESYKIVDGNVEPLLIDNDMVSTSAFEGGHFGVYYFLLNDGKIAKFYDSYWNETLIIYNNMDEETIITYDGDMETGNWHLKINGDDAKFEDIRNILLTF